MDIRVELVGVVIVFVACWISLQAKDRMSAALIGLSITYGLKVSEVTAYRDIT